MNTIRKKCPNCNSVRVEYISKLSEGAAMQNLLLRSRAEALKEKPTTITLYGCKTCGFVYNATFNPRRIKYVPDYDNTPDYSSLFRNYLKKLAKKLHRKYYLKNKNVVEIGCGKGGFLRLLYNLGVLSIHGFDPAYKNTGTILDRLISKEVFTPLPQKKRADMIICREVLEHIPSPLHFVKMVSDSTKKNGVMYFEVPNLDWIIKNEVFFDFTYEHCNYFTKASLYNVFNAVGWGNITFGYGIKGQYIQAEIRSGYGMANYPRPNFEAIRSFIHNKKLEYKKKINFWKKFVIWGVGGKGTTFLNRLGISYKRSEYAIDINPSKHGRFVPITGQKVVGPEILKKKEIDTIIIMNPIYKKEIMAIARKLGYRGEFILPY